ncbi:hypothetical protein CSB09_04770 [Candidatus Gracilibacteria bacterium]|nr:MAG: hypothetical protein CSB09_04770 [Candidatus Gracilibacteria bacterium]
MFSSSYKKIIFIRHAKAVSSHAWQGDDFDRPLSSSGEESLRILGQYLQITGMRPQKVISSPALRTRQTAEFLAQKFGIEAIDFIDELYLPEKKEAQKIYKKVLHAVPDETDIVLIVAHNPEISQMVEYFSDERTPEMKTGSISLLALSEGLDWKDLKKGTTDFVHYVAPRYLHCDAEREKQK